MNMKIYQVRINLKSMVAGMKTSPSHVKGLVIAHSQKEAEEFALQDYQTWLDKMGYKVYAEIGSIKVIPSSFVLNAMKK